LLAFASISYAVVLAALLAPASSATVLADARPVSVLVLASHEVVLADTAMATELSTIHYQQGVLD
jgi:hypothetical protein